MYKDIYKYDYKGNWIDQAYYDTDGKLTSKGFFKYDERNNLIERTDYIIREAFSKVEEILVMRATWEYEFYPDSK